MRENRGHGIRSEEDGARRTEAGRWRVLGPEVGSQEGEQPEAAEERAAGNPGRDGGWISAVGFLAIEHARDLHVLALVAEEDAVVLGAEAE